MTEPCHDLVRFVDGELDPERAEAFRSHLRTCATCPTDLLEAMQLSARLHALTLTAQHARSDAAPAPAHADAGARAAGSGADASSSATMDSAGPAASTGTAIRSTSTDASTSSTSSASTAAGPPRVLAFAPRPGKPTWKRWAGVAGGVLAAVAAVVLVLPDPARPIEVSAVPTNPFAELKTTPFDVRFTYTGADRFRQMKPRMRGPHDVPGETMDYRALAALEASRDLHGVAIARAWNGEPIATVVAQLRALDSTPAVRNDLAALESVETSEDNFEAILSELEALARSDDAAVSRAAKWNYAILLERLELRFSTAAAFNEIADNGEEGWSQDARRRAATATTSTQQFVDSWNRAASEGAALVETGTPVSMDSLRAAPGVLRSYLYNAVRTAPDRARVLALAAMAVELDKIDGRPILSDYVQRVAKLNFRRRTPLAVAYAKLLQGKELQAAELAALTTPTPAADVVDIVMGAMIKRDQVAKRRGAFRVMVKTTADPWFEIVLAREEAKADEQSGDWLGAEDRLRKAKLLCTRGITYQCLDLALQQGHVYQQLHRVPEARAAVQDALRIAHQEGEWTKYRQLLFLRADIERFNSSTAMARAYANEFRLASGEDAPCSVRSATQLVIAGAALLDVDGPGARRALEAVLTCTAPDLIAANSLADIGRLDPRADDLAQLQQWLGALRASTTLTLTPGERVFADAIEGRLQIERDRGAGVRLLEQVIQDANALPADVTAAKARATAYSVLMFDAARQGDPARALGLVAQELGLPVPGACAVAMNAEDERAAIAVRGADGKDHGSYDVARRRRTQPLTVTADLAHHLTGCTHVQVMARASVQGEPRVLPATLAWSYATGAHVGVATPTASPSRPRPLVITNVTPPAELKLASLLASPLDTSPSVRVLSGRGATPTRVLAEIGDATEIQFHTHALVDAGVSDASHLVLSPEPDGRYALTAEAIRGSELRGHPVVVLAACHSAQGARYQHAPWSLPDAFIAAGARAVFAAGTDIPDLEAGPFFDRVLASVRTGADPATALRDERMRVLANQPTSWVADVMLFE